MSKRAKAFSDPRSSRSTKDAQARTSSSLNTAAWALLAAAIIFSAVVRIRLINIPFERDEGEFAYMGQLILQGVPPYKLAYNMKLPGIYAAYALIMAVFGQSIAGVHLGLLLANVATIILVFLLTRKLFGPLAAGAGAISYAILATNSSIQGTSAHATHFVVLFAVAGFLLLFRALDSGRPTLYLLSGLLFGTSFLMKQPGGAFGILAFLCVVWQAFKKKTPWTQSLKPLGSLAAGELLPLAVTLGLLWATGVFKNFYFWTVTYCRQYATQVSITLAPQSLYISTKLVTEFTWPLYVAGIIGIIFVLVDGNIRRKSGFAGWFFVFSFIALCPGFYFRPHYYVVVLPALATLGGAAVSWLWERADASRSLRAWRFVPILLFAAAAIYPVHKDVEFLFKASPAEACRKMYGGNPFPQSIDIAKRIAADTTAKDTIAVIGSEPQIYFYARRRAAIGYIYMYPLMERHPFAHKMQQEVIRQLEKAKPKYLVFVSIPTSWLKRPESDTALLDWLARNANRLYATVGLVEIYQDDTVDYWGADVIGVEPSSPLFVAVYKRRGA